MTLHAKPTSVLPTSIAVSTAVQYGQPLTGNYSIEITTAKAALAERLLTILGIGGIIIAGLSRPFPDPYAAIGTRARHAATIRPASARKTETAFLLAEYVRVLCLQGIRANPSGKLRAVPETGATRSGGLGMRTGRCSSAGHPSLPTKAADPAAYPRLGSSIRRFTQSGSSRS